MLLYPRVTTAGQYIYSGIELRGELTFARLHHKRQARVDAVGGLLCLLLCHLCAFRVLIWDS